MFFMEGLSGVKFKVYGDVPTKKGPVNGLLVANHQCVSDWVIVDSFAMRLGNAGILRPLKPTYLQPLQRLQMSRF